MYERQFQYNVMTPYRKMGSQPNLPCINHVVPQAQPCHLGGMCDPISPHGLEALDKQISCINLYIMKSTVHNSVTVLQEKTS